MCFCFFYKERIESSGGLFKQNSNYVFKKGQKFVELQPFYWVWQD